MIFGCRTYQGMLPRDGDFCSKAIVGATIRGHQLLVLAPSTRVLHENVGAACSAQFIGAIGIMVFPIGPAPSEFATNPINDLALSPDGRLIALACGDGVVRVRTLR